MFYIYPGYFGAVTVSCFGYISIRITRTIVVSSRLHECMSPTIFTSVIAPPIAHQKDHFIARRVYSKILLFEDSNYVEKVS
jgi:hypothetical protein